MYRDYWIDAEVSNFPKRPLAIRAFRVSAPRKTYWADIADPYSAAPFSAHRPLVRLSGGRFLPPPEGAAFLGKCKVSVRVEFLDESGRSMRKVTFILFSIYQGRTSFLCHSADAEEQGGVAEAELTLYPPPFYKGEGDGVEYFFKAAHPRGEREIESERILLPGLIWPGYR